MTGDSSTSTVIADTLDNVRRVFQVVNEQSKRAEKETGLTGPQLWAMKVIGAEEALRVSDLARRMYLHPATVVGILDRLEKRGIVARTRSQKDRRVVEVDLTPEGRRLLAASPQVAQDLLVRGLESLPPERLSSLAEGLALLVTFLGAENLPPRLLLSEETNVAAPPSEALE